MSNIERTMEQDLQDVIAKICTSDGYAAFDDDKRLYIEVPPRNIEAFRAGWKRMARRAKRKPRMRMLNRR